MDSTNKFNGNKIVLEAIAKAIEPITDGIIVEFHDHLSCDAFHVYVRKDGEYVKQDIRYRYMWNEKLKNYEILEAPETYGANYLDVCLIDSDPYYGTVGLRDTVKLLREKYGFDKAYLLDVGWHTFPSMYMGDKAWVKKYIPDLEDLHVDVDLKSVYGE